jgi:hypothetical protein
MQMIPVVGRGFIEAVLVLSSFPAGIEVCSKEEMANP